MAAIDRSLHHLADARRGGSRKRRSTTTRHKRRGARVSGLVVLALVSGTGHIQASTSTSTSTSTSARPVPPASAPGNGNGIYTPAQVVTGLTQHRHAWVGRVVRIALPVDSMDWARGSSYGLSAYQLSVQLPAMRKGVNPSGDPFDVLVSDQQMKAARHAARAWHGLIPLGATVVLTVRLLGRDTPISDLPLVADATYRGSARQLAPVAALCPTDVCPTDA